MASINTDPTNGETPLTQAPVWGGTGGGSQAAQVYAFNDFKQQFGRNPTQSELSMLAPSYMSGDKNIANTSTGKAAIAAYFNSIANNPTNIQAQQTQQGLDKYKTGQSGFDTTTNSVFNSAVGRNATADELSHFGGLLASGAIDSYGLNQLVGQTAEAQNAATKKYSDTLSTNLQSTQGDYYKNYINPSILSQTAAAGRDPNSSGVQQAEVQAGKQQNYELQSYLANFGASQYGQAAQNQQGVYQQYLNQQYGLQNADVNQQLGQQNYIQQQNTNIQNYQLQQQAYNNYLQQYGKRGGNIAQGAVSGGATGATAGASFGPWGALIGGVAGAGLGAYGASRGNL